MVRGDPVSVVGNVRVAVRLGLTLAVQIYEHDFLDGKDASPVIMFRTSARIVSEVLPNLVAVRPISMRSPWTAELTKLISEIYFVTALPLPSWRMA